jgi:hypothetical protein
LEDLLTVNNVLHDTFRVRELSILPFDGNKLTRNKAACVALQLLEDDVEWHQCIEEALGFLTAFQLRDLFCIILRESIPTNSVALWNAYRSHLSEDCG